MKQETNIDPSWRPRAFAQIEQAVFPAPWSADAFPNEPNRRYYSIWDGDAPAAYLCASLVLDEAELWRIAVSPLYRRRGLAAELLNALIGTCKKEEVAVIFLEVSGQNSPALRFYEKAGFQTNGRRANYYGPGDDALLMSLTL